ncbi:hypothetical protein KFQ06_20670 [Serratia entomophila]|uniref:Uncharacterized protein n=1 Tax=Serratia entomophila TaxID=42906 RepID=A0ABY5CR74_9GAMM|nr:hypothetical protein [Serratia entomophila]USV00409.1 hypothetical protein KFQ06_20670 [Serratia entomophila]
MNNYKLLKEVLMQQKTNIIMFAICCAIPIASYKAFTYNDAKDVFGVLINISAAIFTIVGLWVGFLYPTAMSSIVNDDISYIKNEKDSPRVEKLVYIIIISASIMIGILFLFLMRAILHTLSFYKEHVYVFRYIGMVYIYFLAWLQVRCVLSLIATNLHFVNQLHGRLNKARMEHDGD